MVGAGVHEGSTVPERVVLGRGEPAAPPPRRAYFGPEHEWSDTPVLRRSDLASARTGPLIIEEYDATCLVPPGARCALDAGGNIVIEMG